MHIKAVLVAMAISAATTALIWKVPAIRKVVVGQ